MYRCLRIVTLSFLIILKGVQGFSQAQDKQLSKDYLEQAIGVLAETKAIDQARDLYVLAADTDTTNVKANFEAGYTYIITINKELATKFFLRVYRQNPNYRFDIEYWVGKGYQYGLQFDLATKYFKLYKNKLSKSTVNVSQGVTSMAEVDRRLIECAHGKEFVANPKNYSIIHLGNGINSEYDDYGPVINGDEDELIFTTRRRDGNSNEDVSDDNLPYEDIFISKKEGTSWGKANNIGPTVNRKTNESSIALSADGKTLLIYHEEGNGDIYECDLQKDGTWGTPVPLPEVINSSYKESSVSITKDGNTLYFASNRPGGLGGQDIYVCTKDSRGEWSRVKNLGPTINSIEDEESPFIDYEGITLYFSTKGKNGMGGYDIFKSTLSKPKNEWSEPINLGYPINTPDDDLFYVATKDGTRGYYASVREDGLGYQDLYMIIVPPEKEQPKNEIASNTLEKPDTATVNSGQILAQKNKLDPKIPDAPLAEIVKQSPPKEATQTAQKENLKKETPKKEVPLTAKKEEPITAKKEEIKKPEAKKKFPLKYTIKVIDDATDLPLNAKVKLQGFTDNIMVGVSTPADGVYQFSINEPKSKQYRLSVEKEGYIFFNQSLTIEGVSNEPKEITKTISLRKLMIGVSSILRNIYFDFDKATLKQESRTELNKLESMLRQNSNITVEIGGHTDIIGSKIANVKLSQQRAEAVKSFLVSKGIDPRKIKTRGYGNEKPLASNDDEKEGREFNRRVEFKVLSN